MCFFVYLVRFYFRVSRKLCYIVKKFFYATYKKYAYVEEKKFELHKIKNCIGKMHVHCYFIASSAAVLAQGVCLHALISSWQIH